MRSRYCASIISGLDGRLQKSSRFPSGISTSPVLPTSAALTLRGASVRNAETLGPAGAAWYLSERLMVTITCGTPPSTTSLSSR